MDFPGKEPAEAFADQSPVVHNQGGADAHVPQTCSYFSRRGSGLRREFVVAV
jgi:hypothetical protein